MQCPFIVGTEKRLGTAVAQPSPPPGAETPASLVCVYKLTKQVKGCPINGTTEVPTGGANAIAVVEVGSDPTLQSDFDTYSETFGLPKTTLDMVCVGSSGCSPQGWDLEMAVDTQIARHGAKGQDLRGGMGGFIQHQPRNI